MITELSSAIGTVLFRNCRSLQEEGNIPSSRTGCRLLWSFIPQLPKSTGRRKSSLITDGLQTSLEVLNRRSNQHPCSVDASVTSSGRHTYDHRTLFCYWNSFIPQLPESTGRRKSSLITDGLQTSLEVLNRRSNQHPLQCRCISDFFWSTYI
ncbi:hypothetical protein TNCV_4729041 [Trichonephila clavipes]|nr:hypothetical protein TNCV_4729041 [Trichonephila clavipes]